MIKEVVGSVGKVYCKSLRNKAFEQAFLYNNDMEESITGETGFNLLQSTEMPRSTEL